MGDREEVRHVRTHRWIDRSGGARGRRERRDGGSRGARAGGPGARAADGPAARGRAGAARGAGRRGRGRLGRRLRPLRAACGTAGSSTSTCAGSTRSSGTTFRSSTRRPRRRSRRSRSAAGPTSTGPWGRPAERSALLQRIIAVYQARYEEMADAISREMGAPLWLARSAQAAAGLGHLLEMVNVLASFPFEEPRGTTLMRREPIGVCGLITPWNWPINQIACKVAPALAAGCTMVLKPSEIAPLSGYLFAQILHEAGVPPGVFNLVNGD